MKVRELDAKTDEELRRLADESFTSMEDRGTAESLQHLHTAQFYLSLLHRRQDDRVAARDLRLEIIVIVLIALEIIFGFIEGSKQAAILSNMQTSTAATAATLQTQGTIFDTINGNTAKTVEAVKKLQEAQDNSLKTSNASLRANKQIVETLTNQLKILKVEQDARLEQQSRRPVLELTTVTLEAAGRRAVRVESGLMPGAAGVRVSRTMGTIEVTVYLSLRNIGTSPAINVTVKPRTSSKVQIKCVESGVQLAATPNFSYTPCDQQSGTIPPIYPRPSNRTVADSGWVIPGFDDQYDAMIAVVVIVPLDIAGFDVELVVNAEQITPLVYRLQCHVPT
jgi:hypothetical protein